MPKAPMGPVAFNISTSVAYVALLHTLHTRGNIKGHSPWSGKCGAPGGGREKKALRRTSTIKRSGK